MTGHSRDFTIPKIDVAQLFLNGSGRIGRAPFVVGLLVLLAGLGLFERVTPAPLHTFSAWLVDASLLFAACALVSKRLHDLGLAGWWTSFALLAAVNVFPSPRGLGWLFFGLLAGGAMWLAAAPGERRFNRFGPPPA